MAEMSVRDVYAAENVVLATIRKGGIVDFHGSLIDLRDNRVMEFDRDHLPIMAGMIGGLYRANWQPGMQEEPPTLQVSERAHSRAVYRNWDHSIVLPKHGRWAWNSLVLLHELSHSMVESKRGQKAAHGIPWRRQYAALVGQAVGAEAGLLLLDALAV